MAIWPLVGGEWGVVVDLVSALSGQGAKRHIQLPSSAWKKESPNHRLGLVLQPVGR